MENFAKIHFWILNIIIGCALLVGLIAFMALTSVVLFSHAYNLNQYFGIFVPTVLFVAIAPLLVVLISQIKIPKL